jgi:hypothetical protein
MGGPEYVASLLTHYTDEEQEQFGTIFYQNETFSSEWIAMAPPLWEDAVVYNDGTPATVEQMAPGRGRVPDLDGRAEADGPQADGLYRRHPAGRSCRCSST